MKNVPLQLPWTLESVPHAVLDILRGCNIRCRDCYNSRPDSIKSLAEIEAQLDALTRLRKLHSLSIVGGEITLHPDLVEIVRRVRQRGLFAELFTNGVGLNDDLLTQLKQAGANVIFLHIEPRQERSDLPTEAAGNELKRLRKEKAALVAAHGIEVGLAVTAYPEKLEEVAEAVAFALESPHVCYLLATWWRDVNRMPWIVGNLTEGMVSETETLRTSSSEREVRPRELCQWLEKRFQLTPFASLGSNQDPADPRWLSFMVGTVHQHGELSCRHNLRPTWVERAFLEVSHKLTGRYPFYQVQRPGRFVLHLLLNGFAGGGMGRNLKLLEEASRPGARLGAKRLLFQWPAALDKLGHVVHCQCCPDAVLMDGHLVPLCISDRVTTTKPVSQERSSVLAHA
jgi:hypothetical protein